MPPGSMAVNAMQAATPTNTLSPVDWSEFHVWNFRLQDAEKLKKKTERMGLGTNQNLISGNASKIQDDCMKDLAKMEKKVRVKKINFLLVPASSLTSPSNDMKAQSQLSIEKQWNSWNEMVTIATTITPHPHKSHVYTAYAQFASGAIGGCTATYATHWLDTVKVRMQTLPSVYASTGAVTCLRDTISHEGFLGLYKGATPAVVGQTVKTAIVFMSYGICEELVRKATGSDNLMDLTMCQHASAGAMTGVIASFVLCPLELIKCRLQALNSVSRHVKMEKPERRKGLQKVVRSAPFTMIKDILQEHGVRGLYRGLPGIWVKEVPGSFIYFGSYEAAKMLVRHAAGDDHMHLNSRTVFVCGMFAGLCYCITHPVESVKTRVQVMSAVSETRGFLSSMLYILRSEGVKPLCSGIKPCVVRACLYSGIQFVVYEACCNHLLNSDPDH